MRIKELIGVLTGVIEPTVPVVEEVVFPDPDRDARNPELEMTVPMPESPVAVLAPLWEETIVDGEMLGLSLDTLFLNSQLKQEILGEEG